MLQDTVKTIKLGKKYPVPLLRTRQNKAVENEKPLTPLGGVVEP